MWDPDVGEREEGLGVRLVQGDLGQVVPGAAQVAAGLFLFYFFICFLFLFISDFCFGF
jgi:hypothetical protein